MNREKMLIISTKLKNDHYIYFKLLNVLYIITFENNIFCIKQYGIKNIKYKYPTLKQLFISYYVYGKNLMEQMDVIKLCNSEGKEYEL